MQKLATFLWYLSIFVLASACAPAFGLEAMPAHAVVAPASPLVPFLQQTIFPVLTALFMGFVTLLLQTIGKKYKIDYLSQQNKLLQQLAYQGITKAEEVAAQYAGSKKALTGDDKLSVAVSYVLSQMPKVSEEQANSVVHALLAQIPGVGATGATAFIPGGSAIASSEPAPSTDSPESAPSAADIAAAA